MRGPLTGTCQLLPYLNKYKVKLMTTKLARITSEPVKKRNLDTFAWDWDLAQQTSPCRSTGQTDLSIGHLISPKKRLRD
jgi:hypothetical protein